MQPARFHALRDRTLAAVDRAFAEPVLFIARKGKGQPRDLERFQGEIEAVFRLDDGEDANVSGGRDRDWRTKAHMQRGRLHIDPVKYPSLTAEIGDEVQALSRPGQPYFEVVGVDNHGTTRLVLYLGGSA